MTVPDNQNDPAAFAAGPLQRVEKTHFAFVGGVEDAAPYKRGNLRLCETAGAHTVRPYIQSAKEVL